MGYFTKRQSQSTLNQAQHLRRGQQAERMALRFLKRQSLRLIMRNYRCSRGEIDLIMREAEMLVFVEVRYRQQHSHGDSLESITPQKQQRIRLAAQHYLQQRDLCYKVALRFDTVTFNGSIKLSTAQWIKNAF